MPAIKGDLLLEVKPFAVPSFVSTSEGTKYHLSNFSSNTLAELCSQFRADVFFTAGKPDPQKAKKGA